MTLNLDAHVPNEKQKTSLLSRCMTSKACISLGIKVSGILQKAYDTTFSRENRSSCTM
uniref:Uncharacterized protein n=1 Tax=Anguilla anguilla TaxID=7936 RepID=A0A0E9QME1_ANGAN